MASRLGTASWQLQLELRLPRRPRQSPPPLPAPPPRRTARAASRTPSRDDSQLRTESRGGTRLGTPARVERIGVADQLDRLERAGTASPARVSGQGPWASISRNHRVTAPKSIPTWNGPQPRMSVPDQGRIRSETRVRALPDSGRRAKAQRSAQHVPSPAGRHPAPGERTPWRRHRPGSQQQPVHHRRWRRSRVPGGTRD